MLNVRSGNSTKTVTLSDLVDQQKIELMIGDSLFNSGLQEAEFLIPLLKDLFSPNVTYNDTLTQRFINEEVALISKSNGLVRQGERIVNRGEYINDEIYRKLISYRAQYESGLGGINQSKLPVFIGYFLLTSLVIGVFLLFLQFNARHVFRDFRKLSFMLMWLVVYSYLVYLVESTQVLSAYVIPFCIAPIVIKVFFNDRLALFAHIVIVLIASILSSEGYEFTFLQILAGIVVILSNIEIRNWSKFFISIFNIFVAYALGFLGLSLIKGVSLAEVDWPFYGALVLNILLTLLAYPLIPLLERLFGFTSSITLVELSDMNRPLLKELSLKAPGTLQHSLQVGNLSEAAATRIGADPLLVKVAALYHDVGKVKKPRYFIENNPGESPHNELGEIESAKIIIDHVTDGIAMAKKAGLPNILIDFIRTHHGTTRVEYFYRNFVKNNPDRQFDESLFRYPGPRPRSREETIMMMADSLEAASKSLKNPTEKDIEELVDKIIASKINNAQLENSEISFRELELCKEEFLKMLKSINHVRIEYPEETEKK